MGVYVGQNGGKKINIEMQNTYQEDWAERSLFYNCRMFTEGLYVEGYLFSIFVVVDRCLL